MRTLKELTLNTVRWVGVLASALLLCACGTMHDLEASAPAARYAADDGFASAESMAPGEASKHMGLQLERAIEPGPRADAPVEKRLRIYSGTLSVLVPNVEDAVSRAIALVDAEGGYLQSRDGGNLSLRVPAAKFQSTMATLEKFGKVTRRAEQTEDVTYQHQDLVLRLENARESRQRLIDLLAKATDTKAILEIEQELRRLTDEIERYETDLRNLDHQVAYSRIECAFAAAVANVKPRSRVGLFPWFDRVGVDSMLEDFTSLRPAIRSRFDFFGSDSMAPTGFVLVAAPDDEVRGVAADESLYRTQSIEESPQGDIEFWAGALASDFEQRRGYVIMSRRNLTVDGKPGCELIAETPGDGRPRRYLLLLAVDDGDFSDTLSITEYVALQETFDSHLSAVRSIAAVNAGEAK